MSKSSFACLVVVVVFASLSAAGRADTVVLKDGDRLTGTITAVKDGKLVIETAHIGKVSVDFEEVASFTTQKPLGVAVEGGTRLVGPVRYERDGTASVGTDAGAMDFAAGDFLSAGPPEPEEPRWHGAFEIGVSGQTGNTETFRGNSKLRLKREAGKLTLSGYAAGAYAREDGELSENQQRAGGRTEVKYGTNAFWYTAVDLQRDEFKELDLRTTASAGVGRIWWQQEESFWKTAIGVGFTHESYDGGDNEIFPIAEVISDYGKQLNDTLTFTDMTKFSFDLDGLKGWRAENDAALAVDLDTNGDWQLKLGLRHEYDNDPPDDIERLDTYYYLNAVRKF